MIEVDISSAFAIYLFFVLTVFFLLWVYREGKKRFRSLDKQEGYLWQCSICALIYLEPEEDNLSCCPRCRSFNRRGPGKVFVRDKARSGKGAKRRHKGTE